jgi:hypothetical protein
MKSKQKIAGLLVAIGVVCYMVNLVVYVPRFGAFYQAERTWNFTITHTFPNPADYGLDASAFIINPILAFVAYVLVFIGGGYLFAVLVAKVARQLGYLKEDKENTKQQN